MPHSLWVFSSLRVYVQLLQLCPSLCDSTDFSPSQTSVHGIFQAKILEWGHSLLQGIVPTQAGIEPGSPELQANSGLGSRQNY